MTIPPEAITAAAELIDVRWPHELDETETRAIALAVLEGAAPHIAAAERERIRQRLLDAIKPGAEMLHLCRPMLEGRTCADQSFTSLIGTEEGT